MKNDKISPEIQKLLKSIYDNCQKEDTGVRERQVRYWRRLKLLWEGFHNIWWNEVAHDWRVWDEVQSEGTDQAAYDKPINVFKAYLESIIAALSITVPAIKCFPDDADNTLDLATAKAGDKISELVYRHNDVILLWLHALFIFCTEGMTACYSYPKEDYAYGHYDEKEHDETSEEHEVTKCSNCGFTIDDKLVPPTIDQNIPTDPTSQMNPNEQVNNPQMNQMGMMPPTQFPTTMPPQDNELINNEIDEFMPDNEDVPLHAQLLEGQDLCPACMMQMDPQISREKFITTRLVGITSQPKARICMEIYGGLYVKIPNHVKKQKDTPYLIFSKEEDYSMVVEEFKDIRGNKELIKHIKTGYGGDNEYEVWTRLSPQYQGEYPLNVVTVNRAWIRPAKFNILEDEEDIKLLRKKFPDGVKVVFVNDQFATACNESLDDCWTLTENPLADFLLHEPLGRSLVPIQEITNDLISLVLQTIEHGIGQTFADPAVLDFKAYEQTEVVPGGIFPATPKSGKGMSEGFHELRTATLSGEVLPFGQNIQSMAQLVSGALPSLFGGSIEGSETASQYSMSRAQALQRLQNNWKLFTIWWKNIFGKVVPMYINEMKDDERDVQRDNDGNFINVFIRKSETEGKIGKVELEGNENIPLTWTQKKDVIEKLLQNANPEIIKIFAAPENIALIHESLGLNDFYVPGEDDVIQQYDEIKQLLDSEPIQTGDPMNPEVPSVEIDPELDNNQIGFEICRKWAISPVGRQTKIDNPPGYHNVLLHGKAHLMIMQQQMMQQQMAQQVPPKKSNTGSNETPITGENNVQSHA